MFVINPLTSRKVRVGTLLYKKLLKNGIIEQDKDISRTTSKFYIETVDSDSDSDSESDSD